VGIAAGGDIVLLDCPSGCEGLVELAQRIAEVQPEARLVLLTSGTARESAEQATVLHASGWAGLSLPVSELVHAITYRDTPAANGRTRPPLRRHRSSGATSPLSSLTERETSVLQLVVDGHSPEEIADRLDISRHTVRTHLQNVMAKLLVRSRTELVGFARNAGMHSRRSEADR